jgi:hypothetical protein
VSRKDQKVVTARYQRTHSQIMKALGLEVPSGSSVTMWFRTGDSKGPLHIEVETVEVIGEW